MAPLSNPLAPIRKLWEEFYHQVYMAEKEEDGLSTVLRYNSKIFFRFVHLFLHKEISITECKTVEERN